MSDLGTFLPLTSHWDPHRACTLTQKVQNHVGAKVCEGQFLLLRSRMQQQETCAKATYGHYVSVDWITSICRGTLLLTFNVCKKMHKAQDALTRYPAGPRNPTVINWLRFCGIPTFVYPKCSAQMLHQLSSFTNFLKLTPPKKNNKCLQKTCDHFKGKICRIHHFSREKTQ